VRVRDPCGVRRFARTRLVWLAAAALATAAGVLVLSGDEEGGGPQRPAQQQGVPTEPSVTTPRQQHGPRGETSEAHPQGTRAAVHEAVRSSPAPRLDPGQREVARVVRSYVAALNAREGGRICGLFIPGGLAQVDFPRNRGSCAASLSASIGYRDPRGFPVYDSSRIGRIASVTIDGSGANARVVATTVTHFAGSREPSVEDDLVYLRNEDERWLIVKPSASLYRAVGVGDIPPQVLAPP
jgi:hypothetical protein